MREKERKERLIESILTESNWTDYALKSFKSTLHFFGQPTLCILFLGAKQLLQIILSVRPYVCSSNMTVVSISAYRSSVRLINSILSIMYRFESLNKQNYQQKKLFPQKWMIPLTHQDSLSPFLTRSNELNQSHNKTLPLRPLMLLYTFFCDQNFKKNITHE